jgi:D-alanyl-D-alanine carboxypeptidase
VNIRSGDKPSAVISMRKSGHTLVYEVVVNDVPFTAIEDIIKVFDDEGIISAILWRDY